MAATGKLPYTSIRKFDLDLRMSFTTNNDTFHALFNYASIGILITNSCGEILMANKYIAQQFGYDPAVLIGRKIEVLIPARYGARHVRHREQFSRDPHSRPMGLGMELSGARADGSEFPVEVSLGHYTVDGENYALAFINDITQRKETEQAIIELNAHLEEKVKEGSRSLAITVGHLSSQIKETERKDAELERANTFLNNIWNHAGAIIFVADRDGLLQFFNPAAEKWLGYSAAEAVDKMNVQDLHLTDELAQRAHELSGSTGSIIRPGFEVLIAAMGGSSGQEWHYVRKDGSTFFVSLNITRLNDAQNNLSGYLGIAIDISEKKKAETELRAALEKEKELNELRSRFVSMASHEFRTPLSAVLSSAYLLSRYAREEEQPQRERHIQRIVSSVTSLTEILNDLLSVGKIEEGNIEAKYREYDITVQMQEVMQEVQHLLKKQQYIAYTHVGMASMVYLDAAMMKHIVINLLSNAVKFSDAGSVIELITDTTSAPLTLSVHDQGIGIPEADVPQLFQRFFRSSNVTNIQGTGLGLHIVSRYTELMNGRIACESIEGKGTKFTITFAQRQ